MKTVRLIGAAMMAVLASVNFVACDSDDDNDASSNNSPTSSTSEKKLTKMTCSDDGGSTYNIAYDSNGKVASISGSRYGDTFVWTYTWSENTVSEEQKEEYRGTMEDDKTFTYTLSNGLVQSFTKYYEGELQTHSFSYNSSNYMTYGFFDDYYGTLTWKGGELQSIDKEGLETFTYSYSGESCKGYLPLLFFYDDDDEVGGLWLAHPDMFGAKISQLPSEDVHFVEGEYETHSYSYTFDSDNYLIGCTIVVTWDNESDTTTYTFAWE